MISTLLWIMALAAGIVKMSLMFIDEPGARATRAAVARLRAEAAPTAMRTREARERVAAHLARTGLKRSTRRDAVLEAFLGAKGHLTVDELTAAVHRARPGIGSTTVYRTMKLLVDCGVAAPQRFDGHTRYERVLGRAHHDHLLCTTCGAIHEFEDEEIERLQAATARRHGFEVTSHRMELYGRCARCAAAGRRAPPKRG
jgi:Fur family transcriptional regulator, ferric uptake regulator